MDFMFRIHEFILLLYFISLSALSYDLFFRNRQARKVSFYIAVAAAGLQIAGFIGISVNIGRIPVQTTFEGLYALSILIILTGLLHYRRSDSEIALFIYVLTAFLLFAVHTFAPVQYSRTTEVSTLMNELLVIHVGLALFAYVLFFVSALHAVIYVIQYDNLKKKRFNRLFFSLFSVGTAEKMMVRTLLFGVCSMAISILLGAMWGINIMGTQIFTDIKVLGTCIVLLLYAALLFHLKTEHNILRFAKLNIIIFFICMLNYIFITQLSQFHFWGY
ncbi:MAG TPA: cytochrome c biogenesis protein [Candidatus Salinicoccus stercoripullorum]|uniref:Cytochrome c biogenesis protein n=1 Tax=Candidatus Salinicoccus stercoripullorum TaxID=2838756 RepID=A0A9D1QGH3_9STAP|nr:cytochrome c biogenesis protein [Candidatus Salinicoccus stercoripullorum]